MKRRFEKLIDFIGLPKFLCYFCDDVVFLTRQGLNKHIERSHGEKVKTDE